MKSDFENFVQLLGYLQTLETRGELSLQAKVKIISNISKQLISWLEEVRIESVSVNKKATASDNLMLTPTSFYLKREHWLKVAEAAYILDQTDGHITHLANRGDLLTNGEKGAARRISLADILLFQQERNQKNAESDERDIARDKRKQNKSREID